MKSPTSIAGDVLPPLPDGTYVAGEMIIRFKAQALTKKRNSIREANGLKKIRYIDDQQTELLSLNRPTDLFNTIEALKKQSDIEFVQPNYIYKIGASDPMGSLIQLSTSTPSQSPLTPRIS